MKFFSTQDKGMHFKTSKVHKEATLKILTFIFKDIILAYLKAL